MGIIGTNGVGGIDPSVLSAGVNQIVRTKAASGADANNDGNVSRTELTRAATQYAKDKGLSTPASQLVSNMVRELGLVGQFNDKGELDRGTFQAAVNKYTGSDSDTKGLLTTLGNIGADKFFKANPEELESPMLIDVKHFSTFNQPLMRE